MPKSNAALLLQIKNLMMSTTCCCVKDRCVYINESINQQQIHLCRRWQSLIVLFVAVDYWTELNDFLYFWSRYSVALVNYLEDRSPERLVLWEVRSVTFLRIPSLALTSFSKWARYSDWWPICLRWNILTWINAESSK